MAAYEVLLLNTAIPQIQAAQSGDTYVVPRDIAINASASITGNLGIGTSSPSDKLQVTSSGGLSTIFTGNDINFTRAGTAYITATGAGSSLAFGTANTTSRMLLDSSGNLGLGVTPNANWSSFNKIFQFGAGALANFFSDNNTMLGSNLYFGGSPSNWRYISTGQRATLYRMLTGAHEWHTTGSTTGSADGIASALTQAMTLDASGNLLVGTTTVLNSAKLTVSQASGVARLSIQSTLAGNSDASLYLECGGTDSSEIKYLRASQALTFITSGSERARITSNGHFKASNSGTYDSATGTYHELYQTADSRGVLVRATNASFSSNVIEGTASRTTTASNYNLIYVYNGNATGQFAVRDSGNALNSNNSYGSISDQKLKQDIVDAGSQWDDIKNLQVRKYRFKATPDAPLQIGLVAQELEQVSPGLVEESPDRDAEGNDLGTTTKAVKYSVLYMKAVKALQEAMARIEQLEAKVASLGA